MATRSHTTFKKRQKEQARVEKQQEKAARRMQKKQEGEKSPTGTLDPHEDPDIDWSASVTDPMRSPYED